MKVERTREKDGKLEFLVQLSPAETSRELQLAALQEIEKNGYNYKPDSGISPVEFIKRQLGEVEAAFVLDGNVMRHCAPFAFTSAMVDVIGSPVYRCSNHAAEDRPFKYQLVCVPVQHYELESYGPVTVSVPGYEVSDEEVDAEIARLAKAHPAVVTDASHEVVAKGDKVELSMNTTMKGKKVKPLCFDGREYTTGAQAMPDDFDAAVIGMKVGETKSFTFFGPDIALDADGKPKMDEYATTVTVKRIITTQAPSLDDEWAKEAMPGVKSFAELREKVVEQVGRESRRRYEKTLEMFVGNELATRLKGGISDLVYGVAFKEARDDLNRYITSLGLTQEQYLEKEGMTQESLNNALMMQVRTQLSRQLALNAYADYKKIEASDADIDAYFESISPGKANLARLDFKNSGRMYAAICAARRLKAVRVALGEAEIKTL